MYKPEEVLKGTKFEPFLRLAEALYTFVKTGDLPDSDASIEDDEPPTLRQPPRSADRPDDLFANIPVQQQAKPWSLPLYDDGFLFDEPPATRRDGTPRRLT